MSARTLKLLCAISILLNIFLIGATVGGAAWVRTRQPAATGGSIRAAGAELPREQRRAFRQTVRQARREMQPTMMAAWQARQQAAALLRADTVDQAALVTALAQARSADLAVRAHVETQIASFAATLPATARARLADSIARRPAPAQLPASAITNTSDGIPRAARSTP